MNKECKLKMIRINEIREKYRARIRINIKDELEVKRKIIIMKMINMK